MSDWKLPEATRDQQSITSDWELTTIDLIDGVVLKEVKNVPKSEGHLVELFRADWSLPGDGIAQVFMVSHPPGSVSAWHAHPTTTDRLFIVVGMARIVLYDARTDSSTYGRINEFKLGHLRPGLVVVPPKVWHGVQSIGTSDAIVVNMVDRAYDYEDPDHWRVPPNSPEVPYSWA